MRVLNLTNISGFRVTKPEIPVIIRDERGVLFYTTEPLLPKVKEFNLPEGKYIIDRGFFVPGDVVKFPLPKLPSPERVLPIDPKTFAISFIDNPSKCTVNWKEKTIKFDRSFKEKPLPLLMFVLYHEYGHRFYGCKPRTDYSSMGEYMKEYTKQEGYCDLFAIRMMLQAGFNPSQTYRGQIHSLSTDALDRMHFVKNQLTKIKW